MLTQAEIDALLNGALEIEDPNNQGKVNLAEIMGQGEKDGKQGAADAHHSVQPYNFWSPDRFSKEQMRAVELVHEDFTERLATSLPSFLRTNLRPRLVHSEQGRFHDFLKDIPATENNLFHLISLSPLPGQMVITFTPNISYIILEQRLGGKIEGDKNERSLTDIDQSLLRGVVEHMLGDIKSAWAKLVLIEPALEDSTVNQHWVQMLMGNDRVMLITIEISIQGVSGAMNMYIPYSSLKPIANNLNPHVWISGRKERQVDPLAREAALQSMQKVYLPVVVYLGSVKKSIGELTELKVGDVFRLNTSPKDNLKVEIAGQELFLCQVGKIDHSIAVRIVDTISQAAKSA